VVQPKDIRLRPARERGYAWSVADSQQHLFERELGNANIGIYRAIIKELGHSIEAITPQMAEATSNQREQPDETGGSSQHASSSTVDRLVPITQSPETRSDFFTETIQRLKYENLKFADQLGQARAELQHLSQQKEQWDTKSRALQEQLVNSQSRADQLEKELYLARGNIAGAIDILQDQQLRIPTPRKRMRII
jgi:predicted RNase H-like nuclease (RuvC/YqgF family)